MFGHNLAGRNPQVRVSESELRGHHSNDSERLAVGRELLPDYVWVGGKATLPEALADEGDSSAAKTLFIGLKNAAKHCLDAQHGEQGSGGHQPGHALGPVSSGEAEAFFPVGRQAFEDLVSISPIQEVGSGDGFLAMALKVALKDDDDPIRIGEGKRTKQDCVDHTEDHAVRPDAQSQH